jgi:hypothetical protein
MLCAWRVHRRLVGECGHGRDCPPDRRVRRPAGKEPADRPQPASRLVAVPAARPRYQVHRRLTPRSPPRVSRSSRRHRRRPASTGTGIRAGFVIRGRLPGRPVVVGRTGRPTPWNRRRARTQDHTSNGRAPRRTFGSSGTIRGHEVMPCRRRGRRPRSAGAAEWRRAAVARHQRRPAFDTLLNLRGWRTS